MTSFSVSDTCFNERPIDIILLKPKLIFSKNFYRYLAVTDIRFATDTDIPRFAYRYIYRYFNNVISLKLM